MADMYTDLVDTLGPEIRDSLELGGDDALTHGLGSVLHTSATLAQLNALVSDATLDTSSAARPPSGPAIAALTVKAIPTTDDELVIADVAAADAAKNVTILSLPVFHTTVAGEISGATAKALPVAADSLLINDSADTNALKSVTIGTLPVAQAQVASIVLQPAADAAVALLGTTGGVQLVVTAAATVVISTDAGCYAGQKIHLFALAVAGGGSYTLALDVGTLTFDAASESAVVQRNPGNTAWICVGLSSATIV